MDLRSEGIVLSQNAALDIGLDEVCFVETAQGLFLLTSNGPGGGLASYERTASGTRQLRDQTFLPVPPTRVT